MKLGQVDGHIDLVAQVSRDEVALVWASGYWDGPIDGLASFRGTPVWFCLAEEAEAPSGSWFRRFCLVRLSAEQLAAEQARHEDFRRWVGTHFDYDDEGLRDPSAIRPQSDWPRFYVKYPENERGPGDISDNEVLGWFEY
jgi:hypothetical protein